MIRSGLFGTGGNAGAAAVLLGVEVRAEVVAGHACAVVRQRYKNDEKTPIEAVYTFPLPSKGVLTGFSMTVEGRRMEGEVHEREEAFRRYDDAMTAGHGAALLEQERPNIFTANVGNLLPGEETVIEVQYIEPLLADEGALRWSIPTVVAPRYIPGEPSGDRTAHGTADPTTRVPDADRISPPIGAVSYGLALDLTFDIGVAVEVESPSHKLVVRNEGTKTRVTFAQAEVALDRDVVVTAYAKSTQDASLASTLTHRVPGKTGTFALTLVPDLGAMRTQTKAGMSPREVVFVVDRSGSMGGSSMPEARTALRLCLRQLREGDRFGILAFDDSVEAFSPKLVPFTQATLKRADEWIATIEARGGTELLAPMVAAAELSPDGVIVLLTDGEVGNEDEILEKFMAVRRGARVYSFGIGTNVSDALLLALGDKTGGAVEMIHPGERVDEKVVAQFARATAARVTDVTIKARGVELGELAPSQARPLVDSEPYCVFGTYEEAGRGAIEIRGKLDGEVFFLDVPIDLLAESDRPAVAKLWAQARIRELERANVTGRRADAMKDRIVKLAIEHGVSSKYTSFVVVEKRVGDRRATTQAETRVVAVNAPAGWAMFQGASGAGQAAPQQMRKRAVRMAPAMAMAMRAPMPMAPGAMPPPRASAAGLPPPPAAPAAMGRMGGGGSPTGAAPPMRDSYGAQESEADDLDMEVDALMTRAGSIKGGASLEDLVRRATKLEGANEAGDSALEVLSRQGASGMWEEPGRDALSTTVDALLILLRLGMSTAHAVYGAQIKKALDAIVAHVESMSVEPRLLELALGVAWLLASGRRTRGTIEDAARRATSLAALTSALGNETAVRERVERLAEA